MISSLRSLREILSGNILIFTLGDVVRQLSIFIAFPYFSLYVRALGGSLTDVGLTNSLLPLAAFFILPIAGHIADNLSRVRILALTGYLSGLVNLAFAFAPDWRFLALGNFCTGLLAFQFPAMNSLMADSMPAQRRGMGYSIWIGIPSGVGVLSPYVGGYLISLLGVEMAMRLLYFVAAASMVAIATMNLKFLKETRLVTYQETRREPITKVLIHTYKDVFEILKDLPPQLRSFSIILALSFFANNMTAPYWVVYGLEWIGLDSLQWGQILLVSTLISGTLLVPAGLAVDRTDVRRVISVGLAVSSISILLFPLSRGFDQTLLIFATMSAASVFLTVAGPAFMATHAPKERRGRVMAALGQGMLFVNTRGGSGGPGMGAVLTVPSLLGSALGGYAYTIDPVLPWILFALIMGASAAISKYLRTEGH